MLPSESCCESEFADCVVVDDCAGGALCPCAVEAANKDAPASSARQNEEDIGEPPPNLMCWLALRPGALAGLLISSRVT